MSNPAFLEPVLGDRQPHEAYGVLAAVILDWSRHMPTNNAALRGLHVAAHICDGAAQSERLPAPSCIGLLYEWIRMFRYENLDADEVKNHYGPMGRMLAILLQEHDARLRTMVAERRAREVMP